MCYITTEENCAWCVFLCRRLLLPASLHLLPTFPSLPRLNSSLECHIHNPALGSVPRLWWIPFPPNLSIYPPSPQMHTYMSTHTHTHSHSVTTLSDSRRHHFIWQEEGCRTGELGLFSWREGRWGGGINILPSFPAPLSSSSSPSWSEAWLSRHMLDLALRTRSN